MNNPQTIREELEQSYSYAAKSLARTGKLVEIVEELGIAEESNEGLSVSEQTWATPMTLTITYWAVEQAKLASELVKKLLPKTGKFEKGFDETIKKLQFTAIFQGVKLVIEATPPETCTVEEYEEEVGEVVVPARTVKKFRLVGDCEPVLVTAGGEEIKAPEIDNVALDDIPF